MAARLRVITLLVLAGAMLALAGQVIEAQTTVNLRACKKLIINRTGGGGIGDSLTPRECGTRFTARDPYVALVVNFQRIRETMDMAFQLLDPTDNAVWAGRDQIEVEPDTIYENYWWYAVLPVAADLRTLTAESRELAEAALQFPGRPARERPGDWTLRVVARGSTHTLKFTIAPSP